MEDLKLFTLHCTLVKNAYAQGDITDGAFILRFTKEEADKLTPGHYLWYMALIREDPKEGPQKNTFKGPCTMEVFDRA